MGLVQRLRRRVRGVELSNQENGRFLKKAAQKFCLLGACGAETRTAQMNKVFLLLFVHKKKPFPSSSR
jgi:hypothetical protein